MHGASADASYLTWCWCKQGASFLRPPKLINHDVVGRIVWANFVHNLSQRRVLHFGCAPFKQQHWFYIGKFNKNRMLQCHDASSYAIVKKNVNISIEKCEKINFGNFFNKSMVRSSTVGVKNCAHVKREKQKNTKSLKYDRKMCHFWKCCSHAAWEADFFLILTGDFSVKVDFWNTSRARMRFFHKDAWCQLDENHEFDTSKMCFSP